MKEKLRELQPSILDLLPKGAVNCLAQKFNKRRQNVSLMLKGELGNENNVQLLVEEAVRIIKEEQRLQNEVIKKLGF